MKIRGIWRVLLIAAKWTIGILFVLGLLGIDAKEGESPIAAAQERIAAYERELPAALKDPPRAVEEFPDSAWRKAEKLEFRGKIDFCQPLTKSCLAGVEAHRGEIERLLKANRELHRRYS